MNNIKSNAEKKEWPTLLKDAPVDKDRLESFDRLAQTASELVRRIEGGITVCVNGAWGTGKSTFIKILERKLRALKENAPPKIMEGVARGSESRGVFDPHVFVYDAWAHSGDPLRRAFLSSLLQSLRKNTKWPEDSKAGFIKSLLRRFAEGISKKALLQERSSTAPAKATSDCLLETIVQGLVRWIFKACRPKQDVWAKFEQKLAGRSKEVRKQSKFELGIWGRLVLLVGFVWVVRHSILHEALIPIRPLIPASWPHTVYPRVAELALLVVGTAIIWSRGLSAVLANKGTVSETVSSSEEPVPTSIEFADHFKFIAASALEHNDGRRLIIVLDNLDRLEKAERDNAWAFLRSFIDNSSIAVETWYKQIWVVVPWATPSLKLDDDADGQTRAPNGVDIEIGLSEKLFQIKLDLPPPTLFHWEKSLTDMLIEAFGGSRENFESVIRLFHQKYSSDDDLTMRRIVRFVNDLVVLGYQWKEVPLSTLAAYLVLGGRDGVVKKLREGEQFDGFRRTIEMSESSVASRFAVGQASANDISLAERFAMLHYGLTDPSMAMNRALMPAWKQILQSGDVRRALKLLRNRSSVNALKILAPEFWEWSDQIVETKKTLVLLAALGGPSKGRNARESLLRLRSQEIWPTIVRGVHKVMEVFVPSVLEKDDLLKLYDAYLGITEGSDEASNGALRSIEKYFGSSSLDELAIPQIAGLLSIPSLTRAMSKSALPLLVPFEGPQYLRFCEEAARIAAEKGEPSIEALYEKGFGNWMPKNGWSSVTDGLTSLAITPAFVHVLPLTWRISNVDTLVEALDSIIYALSKVRTSDGTVHIELGVYEATFKYFLGRLGASKVLEVLGHQNNRNRLFDVLAASDTHKPLSELHIDIFLLLLISGATRVATEATDLERQNSWRATHVGQSRFYDVMTSADFADTYAAASGHSKWFASLMDVTALSRTAHDVDIMAYWHGIEVEARSGLLKRFPDPLENANVST